MNVDHNCQNRLPVSPDLRVDPLPLSSEICRFLPGQENEAPGPVLVEPKESQLIRMKVQILTDQLKYRLLWEKINVWNILSLFSDGSENKNPNVRPAEYSIRSVKSCEYLNVLQYCIAFSCSLYLHKDFHVSQ